MTEQPSQPDATEPGPNSKRYFGPQLRAYREQYARNQAGASDASRAMEAARQAILSRLNAAQIPTTGDRYDQIEEGEVFPSEAAAFLFVVRNCFGLDNNQLGDLEYRLAFDILYARLGEHATHVVVRPSDQ